MALASVCVYSKVPPIRCNKYFTRVTSPTLFDDKINVTMRKYVHTVQFQFGQFLKPKQYLKSSIHLVCNYNFRNCQINSINTCCWNLANASKLYLSVLYFIACCLPISYKVIICIDSRPTCISRYRGFSIPNRF